MSALGFKARVYPLLACFLTCVQWIPQIHLWCTADLLVASMAAESFDPHTFRSCFHKHWWRFELSRVPQHSALNRNIYSGSILSNAKPVFFSDESNNDILSIIIFCICLQMVPIESLWKDKTCVITFLRRFP